MKITNKTIQLTPYSIGELAAIYDVSLHTMRKWLKPHQAIIGPKAGQLYTVLQVKTIFEVLGLPGVVEEE